jgi:hypothetical protein
MEIKKKDDSNSEIAELRRVMKEIWSLGGGIKGIILSPYFLLSFLITAFCFRIWLTEEWWKIVFSILPNLLGFSLAAYAMMWTFGDRRLQLALAKAKLDDGRATFEAVHSTFVRFVLTQVAALLSSIICVALNSSMSHWFANFLSNLNLSPKVWGCWVNGIAGCISFFLFIYSLNLAILSTFTIFVISKAYKKSLLDQDEEENSAALKKK